MDFFIQNILEIREALLEKEKEMNEKAMELLKVFELD